MVDGDRFLTTDFLGEDLLAQVVQYIVLYCALYRACAKLWIVAHLCQILDGGRSPAKFEALRSQHLLDSVHLKLNHLANLLFGERLEGDDVVDTVQELRTEGLSQHITACVGSHDDDGVLEVYYTAFVVGQSPVVQYLKQGVEDIGMSLLNLIEENHTVWLATNSLCQLSTLIIAYVSWRRTYQTGDAELLLILTHIDTCHHRLVIEEIFCQSLGKLSLTHTGCAEENETRDRTFRVLQAGT